MDANEPEVAAPPHVPGPFRVDILTLFPEMCEGALGHSILGRAQRAGLVEVGLHNIRAHGIGRHRVVDDTPYGGGSGMVMRVDVVEAAIAAVRRPDSLVLLMAPAGERFSQSVAVRLAANRHLVLVCGHYEGVDGRVAAHLVDGCMSIGDYVLTGGELAALVITDAVARLVPGVLGNAHSLDEESFTRPRLEAPVYTRPQRWREHEVPEVLRGGNHAQIAKWREQASLELTRALRPDLLDAPPAPPSVDNMRQMP
jgi:tRNA (guanine37-N1)-methyltransferase